MWHWSVSSLDWSNQATLWLVVIIIRIFFIVYFVSITNFQVNEIQFLWSENIFDEISWVRIRCIQQTSFINFKIDFNAWNNKDKRVFCLLFVASTHDSCGRNKSEINGMTLNLIEHTAWAVLWRTMLCQFLFLQTSNKRKRRQ